MLVAAILEATERVLGQRGFGAASMRAIAKVAGVSAGSLYQYFNGKDSLVSQLIESRLSSDLKEVHVWLDASVDRPLLSVVQRGCELLVPEQAWKKDALLAMVDALSDVEREGQLRGFLERMALALARFLEGRPELNVDPHRAAHMLVFGLRAAALEAMRIQQPWDAAAVRADVCRMAMGLLAHGSPVSPSQRNETG